jgi:hypothetical protein
LWRTDTASRGRPAAADSTSGRPEREIRGPRATIESGRGLDGPMILAALELVLATILPELRNGQVAA